MGRERIVHLLRSPPTWDAFGTESYKCPVAAWLELPGSQACSLFSACKGSPKQRNHKTGTQEVHVCQIACTSAALSGCWRLWYYYNCCCRYRIPVTNTIHGESSMHKVPRGALSYNYLFLLVNVRSVLISTLQMNLCLKRVKYLAWSHIALVCSTLMVRLQRHSSSSSCYTLYTSEASNLGSLPSLSPAMSDWKGHTPTKHHIILTLRFAKCAFICPVIWFS